MKQDKKILAALCISTALVLMGCGAGQAATGGKETETAITETIVDTGNPEADAEYDADATRITADGTAVTIEGSGAEAEGGVITIAEAGTYVISGDLEGMVQIDAGEGALVNLVLDGVTIQNEAGPAIYGLSAEKLVIIMAEGTSNTLTDGGEYTYHQEEEDAPNAAIFVLDDLTIRGKGILVVEGNFEDGIRSKSHLKIESGTIHVTAAQDAIKGADSVTIEDGSFDISAGDDAFHAKTDITINGGEIVVRACEEGIEGRNVTLNGGNVSITSTDDGINASTDTTGTPSITINGGTYYINAAGDGIDSNGSITVNGGEVYVDGPTDAGNGALDYDTTSTVTGGRVIALDSGAMSVALGDGSSQGYILYGSGSLQPAGTLIELTDSEGKVLVNYTSAKEFSTVYITTAGLEGDGTYTLKIGGKSEEITLAGGVYSNGGMGRGGMGQGAMGQGGSGQGGPGRDTTQGGTPPTSGQGEVDARGGATPPPIREAPIKY